MLSENPLIIIADESVDARIIKALAEANFHIYSIMNECPGISDNKVIELANEMKGFIITEDKDFGDELVYKKTLNIGSMLLRFSEVPIEQRIKLVVDTFKYHLPEMKNSFSVLTSKKLRVRHYM